MAESPNRLSPDTPPDTAQPQPTARIFLIRHGESQHNIQDWPHHDPHLTPVGHEATRDVQLPVVPDLVVVSPMTRTLQTAVNVFPRIASPSPAGRIPVQVWPDLRETKAHRRCNVGSPRAAVAAEFPWADFSECREEWDYPARDPEGERVRAEAVRKRLKGLTGTYRNIAVVSHSGFIGCMVIEKTFRTAEWRCYRFSMREEKCWQGKVFDAGGLVRWKYGPTFMIPCRIPEHQEEVVAAGSQGGSTAQHQVEPVAEDKMIADAGQSGDTAKD